MVMEGTPPSTLSTPSPQCVGREFVRQYYTLLNEAPQYLHRFYSHNSSFVHGGDGKLGEEELAVVVGQSEIHKKILSLNFHDCHAKIRYVDSQATIGTGVVVQVTGELSNSGEPMRRFMQTFVLAPQSPTKYYVHNDIFRYQDEVFNDSDEDEDFSAEQAPPSAHNTMPENNAELDTHDHNEYYKPPASAETSEVAQQQMATEETTTVEPALTNGHNTSDSLSNDPENVEDPAPAAESSGQSSSHTEELDAAPAPQDAQRLSWARLVDSSGSSAVQATGVVSQPITSKPAEAKFDSTVTDKAVTTKVQRGIRPDGNFGGKDYGEAKSQRADDFTGLEEKKPERHKYPDNQQIFVGNLPSNISDFELRDFFKSFGKVLEVRVNRNSNKTPFGFVVFDEESCALKALEHKTLDFNGQKINIEEKRGRTSGNVRPGGRRDGQRHRGGGGNRSGYGGGDVGGGGRDHNRFNSGNRPAQQYQPRR